MKKILTFSLLLFNITQSFSETCKDLTITEIYNLSDFIFLAEIISENDSHFKVKVIEVFKGTTHKIKNIKISNDSDYDVSNIGEKWIFYLKKNNEKTIQMIGCGWSRAVYDSKELYFIPEPPPFSMNKNIISEEFIYYLFLNVNQTYEKINYLKLHQEIILLRSLKNQNRIEFLEKRYKKFENINKLILASILILFLLVVIIFIRVLFQKRIFLK